MHSFSNGLVRSVLIATCGVMIYAHGSWTLDLSEPAEFFSWGLEHECLLFGEGELIALEHIDAPARVVEAVATDVGLPLSCAQPRLGGVSSRQLHAALSKTDATPGRAIQ